MFLFRSNEFTAYLTELANKAIRLMHTHERLEDQTLPVSERRTDFAEENAHLLEWFSEQFEVVRQKFYEQILGVPKSNPWSSLSESSQIGTQTTYRSFQILSA